MKRLKFMLAAAAAIGLASASQAAGPYDGSTDFESDTLNTSITASGAYWTVPSGAEEGDYTFVSGVPNSNLRSAGATAKFTTTPAQVLQLEGGTEPLTRNIQATGTAVDLTAGDVYIDTLVKFTVTPAGDTVEAGSDDKILIYLQEDLTEGSEATNLVVKAAQYASVVVPTPSVTFTPTDVTINNATVVPGDWYRLTIKSFVTNNFTCFTIALNGTELTSGTHLFNANDEYKLFPSLKGTSSTSLTCVGFAGSGAVDDLLFTTWNPEVTVVDFYLVLLGDMQGLDGDVTYVTSAESGTLNSGTNTVHCFGDSLTATVSATAASGYTAAWDTDPNNGVTAGTYYTLTVTPDFVAPDFTLVGGVTTNYANGVYTLTAPAGSVIASLLVDGVAVAAAAGQTSYNLDETDLNGATVVVTAAKPVAAHPWYESPAAVVLASDLPHQGTASDPQYVSAFHGQGEGEYLGLTYSTNAKQFDLFQVDGTNAVTTLRSIPVGDTGAGFRGVAISKTLGIAMTLAYATTTKMFAYPLAGGDPTEVVKPSTHSFDAGAFSPDGAYFFSNALNGESDNKYYVKWSVAVANGVVTLTKVGSKTASGRGRSLAYARINGRDLVFGLVDTGKIVVLDMTGDNESAWTVTDMITTGLPAHSYGTLCVSGVDIYGTTPHLTVATSTNNGATKADVLNVYALTVPATGTVTASLVKSFDEDALTDAYFGDISDSNRYGNTVYVTDDEKTIYFARPDNKLYAAEYATYYTNTFISGEGTTTNVTLIAEGRTEPGRGPVTPAEVTGKTFTGWDPAVVPAVADATYTAQYEAAGETLAPGQQSSTTYDTQAKAETAAGNVEIVADSAVSTALGSVATEAYLTNFTAKVVETTPGSGEYKVEVGLVPAVEDFLQDQVDADAAAVIEDLDTANVTLTTTPGFYYSFEYGTTLDNMAEVGSRTLATGSTLTLPRPTTSGATAGFYKVLVNITDKPQN